MKVNRKSLPAQSSFNVVSQENSSHWMLSGASGSRERRFESSSEAVGKAKTLLQGDGGVICVLDEKGRFIEELAVSEEGGVVERRGCSFSGPKDVSIYHEYRVADLMVEVWPIREDERAEVFFNWSEQWAIIGNKDKVQLSLPVARDLVRGLRRGVEVAAKGARSRESVFLDNAYENWEIQVYAGHGSITLSMGLLEFEQFACLTQSDAGEVADALEAAVELLETPVTTQETSVGTAITHLPSGQAPTNH